MARIRTIKPEFFTSLDMADLDYFTRLVFIGLWTHCDDYGRCIYDPRLIRAALFPLDDVSPEDLRKALETLAIGGQIVVYDHEDRTYLEVAKWDDHQRVSHPGKDKLPASDHPHSILRRLSGDSRETLVPEQGKEQGTGNREQGNETGRTGGDDPLFYEFWDSYPNKVNKQKARLSWNRLTEADKAAALTALPNHIAAWKDPKFIPHPTTWLNGRRWEDEIKTKHVGPRLVGGIYVEPGVDL